MKLGGAIEAVLVTGAGRYPQRTVRGCDPGSFIGGDRQNAAGRIHDLVFLMPMAVDAMTTGHRHHPGEMAVNQHKMAFYRRLTARQIHNLVPRDRFGER
ncbi:Uncharacterised protein [Mycobacteroides abscessus subsp. massiliense]|nr:Uncharacterised protein [Mycobacteroides abscessus subsp. massiliense]